LDEKAEWLKDFLIKEQEGYVKNLKVTIPEINARRALAEKFGLSDAWAYELIRKFVKRYPEFHLQKVTVECGDGKGGLKKYRDWELTWIED
jgi:hypothetical protein